MGRRLASGIGRKELCHHPAHAVFLWQEAHDAALVFHALAVGDGPSGSPEEERLWIELPPGRSPGDLGANGFTVIGSTFSGEAFYL
jgi:hypothetical protein